MFNTNFMGILEFFQGWSGLIVAIVGLALALLKIWTERLKIKELKSKLKGQEHNTKGNTWFLESEPFKALNSVHHFRYGAINEAKNKMLVNVLTVLSLKALKPGNHVIKRYRYSSGKIRSFYESNKSTEIRNYGIDNQKGRMEITWKNTQIGDKRLFCFDGRQENTFGAKQTIFDEGDLINASLKKLMLTDRHDFAGTRLLYPADNVRLMILFSKNYYPDEVSVIKLDEAGNEMRNTCIVERVSNKDLWIVDASQVQKGTSIYAYWAWPKNNIKKIQKAK